MKLILRETGLKLADLKAEDEVSYQMVVRFITIVELLRSSWQSWYDVMAFDVMVEHLLHRVLNEELKERLKAVYKKIVSEIADEVRGTDGYELVHDILKFQKCPLCGR